MADLLRQGSQWLEQMRTAHCSSPVEYRRPPEFWTVQATFGKTGFEVANESGLTIHAQVWDFLILADALPGIEPEPGDVIAVNGRRYEVMNLGGEGCWRWSDPYRQTYRIHTFEKENGAKMSYQQLAKIKRWAKTDRRKWLFIYALCETANINVDSDGDVWCHNERVFDLVFNAEACILEEALKRAKLYEEEWPGNGKLDEFDKKTGRRM